MTPLVHPHLVNGAFGDPALYLDVGFRRRAMLFDAGDLQALAARKLLRVSDVFISHAHMDHFAGFDRIVRACLGRDKTQRLFGPPGFLDRLEHKLAAYDWNLAHRYDSEYALEGAELHEDGRLQKATFRSRTGFRREPTPASETGDGVLLADAEFVVRGRLLDHGIPSLALSLEERRHVNVWKNRLAELGLPVGPWLHDLKAAVLRDEPDDAEICARWRADGRYCEARRSLGELRERVLTVTPGQKVAYVVDAAYTAQNAERIVDLGCGADVLFIEAVFIAQDAALAAERLHLTTEQAGRLARQAGARRVEPFHFSPRYAGREEQLRREVETAFAT